MVVAVGFTIKSALTSGNGTGRYPLGVNDSPQAVSSVTESLPLRVAVWLLAAQSVGLFAIALLMLWLSLTKEESSAGAGVAEAVTAAGVGVLLALSARSLMRGKSRLRGIAVFVELMFLPLGYYLAQAGLWWFAVPAWILGITTVALLVAPSSRKVIGLE